MIAPQNNINIGGAVQLDLIPLSKAINLRQKGMQCVLFIESGFTPVTVYKTYKSDRVQTSLSKTEAGTSYPNEIRWLIPQERLALWESIITYMNSHVLIIATYNDGSQKLFGTPDSPLLLTANPTPQTTPDSFNGVEIVCQGADFLPGRYLYSIVEFIS